MIFQVLQFIPAHTLLLPHTPNVVREGQGKEMLMAGSITRNQRQMWACWPKWKRHGKKVWSGDWARTGSLLLSVWHTHQWLVSPWSSLTETFLLALAGVSRMQKRPGFVLFTDTTVCARRAADQKDALHQISFFWCLFEYLHQPPKEHHSFKPALHPA